MHTSITITITSSKKSLNCNAHTKINRHKLCNLYAIKKTNHINNKPVQNKPTYTTRQSIIIEVQPKLVLNCYRNELFYCLCPFFEILFLIDPTLKLKFSGYSIFQYSLVQWMDGFAKERCFFLFFF